MTLGLAFWILMFLWLILGFYWSWPQASSGIYGPMGNTLILFVLFLLLGWSQFGPPLHH